MKFKKALALISGMLLLASCGGINDGGAKDAKKEAVDVSTVESQYPSYVENEGTPVEATVLKVAVVSDSPFRGIFNGFLYSDSLDGSFMASTMNGAFPIDPDLKIILDSDETPIKVSVNPEEKTVTYKINPNFKWSNGEPVTTKDIVKTYEIMANQEYITSSKSLRYNKNRKAIVGIEEYNKGESKEISGFKTLSDKKFEIHFKKFNPGILWGGGIPFEPVPSHKLKDIPVKEQEAHDITRKNPLSPGPYYIKEIVPGQQVVFEANPHYYKGQPKVKKVVWKIVPSSQIVAALQAGEYDLTVGLNSDLYSKVKDLKNVKLGIQDELSYTYIGFKLGKWDNTKKEVVTDPNAKMADVKLRQAMAYAIDNNQVGEKFYQGLRRNATQLMIPAFKEYYDESLKGYTYDLEKAKKLLDEAGYKDTNNDGIREDKNGKPFKIKFASMSGGAIAEPIANYYIQQWKSIGLDVELTTGRLIEFNSFYEKVQADDPEIDIYQAAWGTGSNPNPTGLYGRKAQFNFSRFSSEELDKIFDKINSVEAVDKDYRAKAYKEFANYMFENVPVVPTLFRKGIVAVNNRVKKWDITPGSNFGLFDVELTADSPVK